MAHKSFYFHKDYAFAHEDYILAEPLTAIKLIHKN